MLSPLLAAAGVICVILSVAALAGGWWAVGVLGVVLLLSAWTLR